MEQGGGGIILICDTWAVHGAVVRRPRECLACQGMAEGHGSFQYHELAPYSPINKIGQRAREGVAIEL